MSKYDATTGAAHSTPINHRLVRLLCAFSDMGYQIENQDCRGKREPLERVTVMRIGANVGRRPFAPQTVTEIVFLLDHDRLDRNRDCRPKALEREILPHV